MPPWTSLLDRLDVPAAMSAASTSATRIPRIAASRATPQPVIPAPMTRRSKGSASSARKSAERLVKLRDEDI